MYYRMQKRFKRERAGYRVLPLQAVYADEIILIRILFMGTKALRTRDGNRLRKEPDYVIIMASDSICYKTANH